MSLAERLDQARRGPERSTATDGPIAANRAPDPFAAVKESVHAAMLESLGPQLYDPHLEQSDLEQRVRTSLQSVLEA